MVNSVDKVTIKFESQNLLLPKLQEELGIPMHIHNILVVLNFFVLVITLEMIHFWWLVIVDLCLYGSTKGTVLPLQKTLSSKCDIFEESFNVMINFQMYMIRMGGNGHNMLPEVEIPNLSEDS